MLVLLAKVVFLGKIDQIDNRFGGEQGQRIDDLDLRENLGQSMSNASSQMHPLELDFFSELDFLSQRSQRDVDITAFDELGL